MLKYIWAKVGDWLSHNICIIMAPLVFRGCFFGPLKIFSWPSLEKRMCSPVYLLMLPVCEKRDRYTPRGQWRSCLGPTKPTSKVYTGRAMRTRVGKRVRCPCVYNCTCVFLLVAGTSCHIVCTYLACPTINITLATPLPCPIE